MTYRPFKPILSYSSLSPANLSPAAWFRAGQGQTVTGSGVSQWDDISGNGRHLKQGTDANRPALQADGTVLFNGTSHFLKCDAFTLNQPETVYLLFKQVSWTGNDYVCDGNTFVSMSLAQSTATPRIDVYAGVAGVANTNLAVGSYGVIAAVFNGTSSVSQVNMTTAVTGNSGTNNAGGFTLGASGTPGGYSNIQVMEAIIFPAAHDADTRARVVRYLMGVGGVA